MKKITSLLLLSILLLVSCAQEAMELTPEEARGKERMVEFDTHVQPMNQIACGNSGVLTRSVATGTNDDNKIADIWVVQFDNSGNFMKKMYCKAIKGTTFDAPLGVNYTGTTSTVYFLANIGDKLATPTSEANFKTMTKTISAEADLLSTDETGKKCVPMMGTITGVTVPVSGYLEKIDITLKHLLAKITVKYSNPTAANFVMENVQLLNVATTYTYQPPTVATTTATTDSPVIDFPIEACTASTGTVTFYVPENQRGDGTNTDASNNERWKIGQGVTKATCVQFTGHVGGIDAGDKITYTFYPGSNNYNNYNLVRNTEYTMDLTFTGASASDRRVVIPERANCILVDLNEKVEIPVGRANESDLGRQLPDNRTGWTASLLWTVGVRTKAVTIDNSTLSKGYFTVTGTDADCNGMVCIKDAAGNILWSWHVWVTRQKKNFNLKINQLRCGNYVWMKKNLGTLDIGFGKLLGESGLMYQWGRKDPFLGSNDYNDPVSSYYDVNDSNGSRFTSSNKFTYPTPFTDISNNYLEQRTTSSAVDGLKTSVRYPTIYITNWKGSTAVQDLISNSGWDSWGGGFRQPKSVYDPCPVGWRVPSGMLTSSTFSSPLSAATVLTINSTTRSEYNNCSFSGFYNYEDNSSAFLHLEAGGYRHQSDGAVREAGLSSYIWFGNISGTIGYAFGARTANAGFSSSYSAPRAHAFPVRCVRSDYP